MSANHHGRSRKLTSAVMHLRDIGKQPTTASNFSIVSGQRLPEIGAGSTQQSRYAFSSQHRVKQHNMFNSSSAVESLTQGNPA